MKPIQADEIRKALESTPEKRSRLKQLDDLIHAPNPIADAWKYANPHKFRDWLKRTFIS